MTIKVKITEEVMDKNQNHPKKGSSIKVEPIRSKAAIERIKAVLLHAEKYRDHCLFSLGINTAYRANELLSITVGQIAHLKMGDALELKQSKNRKHRAVMLNKNAAEAVQLYLANDTVMREKLEEEPNAPLFYSAKGEVLSVPTVTAMVKSWCAGVGLKGNYGSHTMRKTWGYWQYKNGTPLPLLMEAFGHATQRQTLAYLSIQSKEITEVYGLEL